MDPSNERRDDLYLRPLWARRWFIIGVVVFGTLATYGYYSSKPKNYEAETSLFLQAPATDPVASVISVPVDDERNTADQATLLSSRAIASDVARRLRTNISPDELRLKVTVTPQTGQNFIGIRAVDTQPQRAADIANAYAEAFIAARTQSLRGRLAQAETQARRELSVLSKRTVNRAARTALQDRIRQLRALRATTVGSAEQIDSAVAPTAAVSPRPVRNAIFAFALSVLLAVLAAFGLERLDSRVKQASEVGDLYGSPLLATIPHAKDVAPDVEGRMSLPLELREPLRRLRANLAFETLDRPFKTLLVTSALPAEGKSSVVRNLALVYVEAGLRVAIIEADLRRPTMARIMGLDSSVGLTDVLTGDVDLKSALREVLTNAPTSALGSAVAVGAAAESARPADGEQYARLSILTSGAQPPNPPVVLASERMRATLGEAAADHDIVIIDTPPMLGVSDVLSLLPMVDGVLLSARMGVATRDSIRRTREVLDRIPNVRIVGVVADDARHEAFVGGYGYYGYGPDG